MAKKSIATLKTTSGKNYAKVIRMTRSPKTGAYSFNESIITSESVKDYLSKK